MSHRLVTTATTTVALLFGIGTAGAQTPEQLEFSFNGFGTAGLVHSSEDQADFVSNTFVPDGAGRTRNWSPEVDSRLGLQFGAEVTPRLSGVVQFVVEQQHDDTYTPALEWANVKYGVTRDLYVRAGRIVLPGVMVSEYRKVGYALPWIRPPLEVYFLLPLSNSDGIDAGYEFHHGGYTGAIRFNYGGTDADLPDGGGLRARDIWGLTGSLERGPLSLHLGIQSARVTVDSFDPLFDGIRQFGAAGASLAERFDFENKRIDFFAVGARYDPGDWFLMGELAARASRTAIGNSRGWYLTGGYRLGAITPYLTVASTRVTSQTSSSGLPLAGLPPALAATASALNQGLNQALQTSPKQDSVSLGLRWDFARNVALKAQFDYLDLAPGSLGGLANPQPGFAGGGSVSVFSLALDFVF